MPLNNIKHLLGTSAELASVRAQARKQATLQKAFEDYTPVEFADLKRATRVGYIKAGTLFLLANHAAAATKLKQLLPRLLPVFQKLEPEVTGIRVQVQVMSATNARSSRTRKSSLPVDSIKEFEKLSAQVKNRELKLAITNLVRRRAKPA